MIRLQLLNIFTLYINTCINSYIQPDDKNINECVKLEETLAEELDKYVKEQANELILKGMNHIHIFTEWTETSPSKRHCNICNYEEIGYKI